MAEATPTGETGVPADPKTDATPPVTPTQTQVKAEDSEADKLRKELEQAKMRANQLENEKKQRDEADAEAKRKQLEDQEEWKQIAEQEKAKREALETERQEAETKEKLRIAQETIFAEFDESAIEVAKDAGLTLTEDSDEAKNTLKSKLEKISQKVMTSGRVGANNPGSTPDTDNRAELVQKMRMGDKQARAEAINGLKSLDFMRKTSGYSQEQ